MDTPLVVASLIFQFQSLAVFNFYSFESFVFIKGVFIKQTEYIHNYKIQEIPGPYRTCSNKSLLSSLAVEDWHMPLESNQRLIIFSYQSSYSFTCNLHCPAFSVDTNPCTNLYGQH